MLSKTIDVAVLTILVLGISTAESGEIDDSLYFPNQIWLDLGGGIGVGLGYTRQIQWDLDLGLVPALVDTINTVNIHIELTKNIPFISNRDLFIGSYASVHPGLNWKPSSRASPWFPKQDRGIFYTVPVIVGFKAAIPAEPCRALYRLGLSYNFAWSKSLGLRHFPFLQFSVGFGFDRPGALIGYKRRRPPPTLADWHAASPRFYEFEKDYQFYEDPPDSLYGYIPENPIDVAVLEDTTIVFAGPRAIGFYFAHLICECGGQVRFERAGSCCPQPSRYGIIDGTVLIDKYKVKCAKCRKKRILFINMYDPGKKYAPAGYYIINR
jgi:hypothetical protein